MKDFVTETMRAIGIAIAVAMLFLIIGCRAQVSFNSPPAGVHVDQTMVAPQCGRIDLPADAARDEPAKCRDEPVAESVNDLIFGAPPAMPEIAPGGLIFPPATADERPSPAEDEVGPTLASDPEASPVRRHQGLWIAAIACVWVAAAALFFLNQYRKDAHASKASRFAPPVGRPQDDPAIAAAPGADAAAGDAALLA